jgi:hypothetical protein
MLLHELWLQPAHSTAGYGYPASHKRLVDTAQSTLHVIRLHCAVYSWYEDRLSIGDLKHREITGQG